MADSFVHVEIYQTDVIQRVYRGIDPLFVYIQT